MTTQEKAEILVLALQHATLDWPWMKDSDDAQESAAYKLGEEIVTLSWPLVYAGRVDINTAITVVARFLEEAA